MWCIFVGLKVEVEVVAAAAVTKVAAINIAAAVTVVTPREKEAIRRATSP